MRLLVGFIPLVLLSACSSTEVKEPIKKQNITYSYQASLSVNQDIENKLIAAKRENKKLLIALGASWCDDSQAMATNLANEKLQTIIQQHYQVIFVDAGYFSKGFDVVSRFGMPIYYGTPTVMIIDPTNEQLINKNSMHQWLSAGEFKIDDYVQYFNSYANSDPKKLKDASPRLNEYLAQIDQFEQEQAIRLKRAYSILGSALRNYKEKRTDFSADIKTAWEQAQSIRYNIQKDLLALKQQATQAVADNTSYKLVFPSYEAFSWEK